MKTGKYYFQVPDDFEQRAARQQPRPLSFCPKCKYVLCSCGCCHSEECLDSCLYDDDSVSASSSTGAAEMSDALKDLMKNRLDG